MLKRVDFFKTDLEYSAPARGGWTIVHVGMLVPEAHEIFVCAAGCLRGVVLSAAEMNMSDRFSTIAVEEHNIIDGDMEELIIEGVTDIMNRLPARPKAVLVYTSCIHHFVGCDLEMCYDRLRERFRDTDFTDCYMIPTMRKSGLTPDMIMRSRLYSLLKPAEQSEKHCAVVGNCFTMGSGCDLIQLLNGAGITVHQITECRTYEEYQNMACCSFCICTQPVAREGATELERRLGMKSMYLPLSYGYDEIEDSLVRLSEYVGTFFDTGELRKTADEKMNAALKMIGDTPIAVDYTATPRPFGLARLLTEKGFNVVTVYADSVGGEDRTDAEWLRTNKPETEVCPTVHPSMRKRQQYDGSSGAERTRVLAIGQKAAYFTGSPYFVNIVEAEGLYGFKGIAGMADLMMEAFVREKDVKKLISIKGRGCESCI